MKSIDIKNVSVSYEGNRASLSCEADGAAYHVWVDRQSRAINPPTLFKNPLTNNRDSPDFFRTKSLNIGFNAELINLMFFHALNHNLWAKAEEEEKEKKATQETEGAELVRLNKIKEAALDLYNALRVLGDSSYCFCIGRTGVFHTAECLQARAALAKAEGKE